MLKNKCRLMNTIACSLIVGLTSLSASISHAQGSNQRVPAPCVPWLIPTGDAMQILAGATKSVHDGQSADIPLQVYSIGDPTGEETFVLECINRARANPAEEGHRLATTTDADVV